ncbi:helix-turn-helix domain-containing protein [Streptomyces sp. NPDC057702]|uniref:helix-turn-helix domain-containing protein n=1 Tax=unclassified Streptomyces TaxID=2593676 RepID=UPI00369FC592
MPTSSADLYHVPGEQADWTPGVDPVPLHRLSVPAPNILPFAIGTFDSIGPLSRAAFPHRHTFYELLYVTSGTGTHVIEQVPWRLRPPHLCVIAPGQVHYWAGVRDLQGWVVLFTDDFLISHPEDRAVLRRLAERPWLHPEPDTAPALAALISDMGREFREREDGFITVLRSYLHVLTVRAQRLPGALPPEEEAVGRSTAVARQFAQLLTMHTRTGGAVEPLRTAGATAGQSAVRATVGAYAVRIGVSVGYLTEAVKRTTGRTPGQMIREAEIREAKRLLAATGLTVSQVAREVGFSDPAYFCRFFRRETGVSPGDFRRQADRDPVPPTAARPTGGNHHVRRIESIDRP